MLTQHAHSSREKLQTCVIFACLFDLKGCFLIEVKWLQVESLRGGWALMTLLSSSLEDVKSNKKQPRGRATLLARH